MIVCVLLSMGMTMHAQKSELNKAKSLISAATVDMKKLDYAKVDEAVECLKNCMQDPVTSVMAETWSTAGRARAIQAQNIYAASQTGTLDTLAYFDAMYDIVAYYSKSDVLDHTPNAKGKLPKAEELDKNRKQAQGIAMGPRQVLLTAGSVYMNSNPQQSMKYIDMYLNSFDDPLFEGLNLNETDTMKVNAYLFKATALQKLAKTPEDNAEIVKLFEKGMDSKSFGFIACNEIIQIYKEQNDMANWEKYSKIAIDKYPDQASFLVNLLNYEIGKENFEEASKYCDLLIERFPDKDYGPYQKGAIYYRQQKYAEAQECFKKAMEVNPESTDAVAGVGNCYLMMAQQTTDKTKKKQNYDEALTYYFKLKDMAPGNSDLWGYQIYAIYNNTGQAEKAKAYKKYDK